MRFADAFSLSFGSLRAHRLRTALSVLGIAIGISAVILITAIGEGTRQFLQHEFRQFGTNIFQINPGKTETSGMPGIFGGTTRKLTIEDAEALRNVRGVDIVLPTVTGMGRVEAGRLGRSVYVIGVNSEAPKLWQFEVRSGTFLKAGDPRRGAQELTHAVANGEAGAIFAVEVSRLARCSQDWQRLLALCAVAEVVVVDEQAIYDPQNCDDKLLLDSSADWDDLAFLVRSLAKILAAQIERALPLAKQNLIDLSGLDHVGARLAEARQFLDDVEAAASKIGLDLNTEGLPSRTDED